MARRRPQALGAASPNRSLSGKIRDFRGKTGRMRN
jgi:hypothetical protein